MARYSYFDTRTVKTYCGRCDSASWSVLAVCSACGDGCCDDCATPEGKADLLCSRCAEREAEMNFEAGLLAGPRLARGVHEGGGRLT